MHACVSDTCDDKSNGAPNAGQLQRIPAGHIFTLAQTVAAAAAAAALGSIRCPHGVNVTRRVSVSWPDHLSQRLRSVIQPPPASSLLLDGLERSKMTLSDACLPFAPVQELCLPTPFHLHLTPPRWRRWSSTSLISPTGSVSYRAAGRMRTHAACLSACSVSSLRLHCNLRRLLRTGCRGHDSEINWEKKRGRIYHS